MLATHKPLTALTAQDVMRREVKTIPYNLPLPEAAEWFVHEHISGAPVVDNAGRCIGVLSLPDIVRNATEGRDAKTDPLPSCSFQLNGRLVTGEPAVICTLPEGRCPLQEMRPTTGGRHTLVCRQPCGTLCDWQVVPESMPNDTAGRHMTADIVTAGPTALVTALARQMLDAHIHRVIVVDDECRPIGIVSSTDILAAVAYSAAEEAH